MRIDIWSEDEGDYCDTISLMMTPEQADTFGDKISQAVFKATHEQQDADGNERRPITDS